MNNLVCSKFDLQNLRKETFKDYLSSKLPIEKIDITELSDTMFTGDNYILNKYFFYRDHSLDRLHCFNITEEEYANAINSLVKKPTNETDLKLESASLYWKKKIFAIIIAEDLGLNPRRIDMSEYIHNPEYYEMYDFDDNRRYLEDKFREEEHEVPTYTDRTCVVDKTLLKELHETCILLIKNRLAMIFDVYSVLISIDDIRKYTDGFNTNCLKYQMDTLYSHKARIQKILADKETVAWIKSGNNDYTLYANGDTLEMYISEYHKIICKLNDIYGEYTREEFDILADYIDLVIKNPIDEHISRYFAVQDIDDYLMSHIDLINSRKIKIDKVDDEGNVDIDNSDELVCVE